MSKVESTSSTGSTARGQRLLTTEPNSPGAAMIRGRLLEVDESVEEFLARPAGWKRDRRIRPEGGASRAGSSHLGARDAD
jgi:hypothetical protein